MQKVQLVTSEAIYNILLSKTENGCVNINFVDEVPEILLGMYIKISDGVCLIQSEEIELSTSVNNFNNSFSPVIIYKFLMETDFENEQFTFESEENAYSFEKNVLGRTVVFTVQLSLDENPQSYMIEIK